MASTTSSKTLSERDPGQTLQAAFNDNDKSLSVSSYVVSKVGAKITRTISSSTVDDFRYLDVTFTKSGTENGTAVITGLTQVRDHVQVGMYVFGTNIPANTTVLSIDSDTQVTLTASASSSGSDTLQFANLLYLLRVTYDDSAHDNVNIVERIL